MSLVGKCALCKTKTIEDKYKKRQEDFFRKLFSLGFHHVAIFRNRLETESQSMFCTSFGSYNGRILNIFRVKGLILVFLNKNNGGGAISL